MFYHARLTQLNIADTVIDHISFGTGEKHLIMIPGLGEGLADFKGMAVPYAALYHIFAKEYQVHLFSRRKKLPQGFSTADMAGDIRETMEQLKIDRADVVGVSLGGMIAQHLALDYPEKMGKLVLVVTLPRPSEYLTKALSSWSGMAEQDRFRELMLDNLEKMYTEDFLNKNKWMRLTAGKFGKPDSYDRFLIQAKAGLEHNCYERLGQIKAPTLVIGGELDVTVGAEGSRELADRIPGSRLFMYPQYGHALYEEDKGFNQRVLDYLRE